MAKKQPPDYDLPTLEDQQEEPEVTGGPTETGRKPGNSLPLCCGLCSIPFGDIAPDSYLTRHVEVQLDQEQATTLKRLFAGLDLDGARLKNGRRITSHADTLRYVLEQFTPPEERPVTPTDEA